MSDGSRIVRPGRTPREVKTDSGEYLSAPSDWVLVPPGDPALSRRVKAGGAHWLVQEKKGRKLFSRGIWAPKDRVERITAALAVERADPAYQRKLDAARNKREVREGEYAAEFERQVLEFLDFAPCHGELAKKMAAAIAAHATPVGSQPPDPVAGASFENGPAMLQSCGTPTVFQPASAKSAFSAPSAAPWWNFQPSSSGITLLPASATTALATQTIELRTILMPPSKPRNPARSTSRIGLA